MKRHWSVDEDRFRRTDPDGYLQWQLEQQVNFGIGQAKLKRSELIKYWDKLDLDSDRKRYLARILWPNRS